MGKEFFEHRTYGHRMDTMAAAPRTTTPHHVWTTRLFSEDMGHRVKKKKKHTDKNGSLEAGAAAGRGDWSQTGD